MHNLCGIFKVIQWIYVFSPSKRSCERIALATKPLVYCLYSKQHDVYDSDGRFHAESNVSKIHRADHGEDH